MSLGLMILIAFDKCATKAKVKTILLRWKLTGWMNALWICYRNKKCDTEGVDCLTATLENILGKIKLHIIL